MKYVDSKCYADTVQVRPHYVDIYNVYVGKNHKYLLGDRVVMFTLGLFFYFIFLGSPLAVPSSTANLLSGPCFKSILNITVNTNQHFQTRTLNIMVNTKLHIENTLNFTVHTNQHVRKWCKHWLNIIVNIKQYISKHTLNMTVNTNGNHKTYIRE